MILDQSICDELEMGDVSVLHAQFLLQRRENLVQECQLQIKQACSQRTNGEMCGDCRKPFLYDIQSGDWLCTECGMCIWKPAEEFYDVTNKDRFNRNPIHHYLPKEHFYQTLTDMTCTGRRKVPPNVMRVCEKRLGRSKEITNFDVFRVLKQYRFRNYYACRYEIASRLRGSVEIDLSATENRMIRMHFARLHSHFFPYQKTFKVGFISKRGKYRLYWPVGFIMSKLLGYIGREDLVKHIKQVKHKQRLAAFNKHWDKFEHFVNNIHMVDNGEPIELQPIGKTRHKYKPVC